MKNKLTRLLIATIVVFLLIFIKRMCVFFLPHNPLFHLFEELLVLPFLAYSIFSLWRINYCIKAEMCTDQGKNNDYIFTPGENTKNKKTRDHIFYPQGSSKPVKWNLDEELQSVPGGKE